MIASCDTVYDIVHYKYAFMPGCALGGHFICIFSPYVRGLFPPGCKGFSPYAAPANITTTVNLLTVTRPLIRVWLVAACPLWKARNPNPRKPTVARAR